MQEFTAITRNATLLFTHPNPAITKLLIKQEKN